MRDIEAIRERDRVRRGSVMWDTRIAQDIAELVAAVDERDVEIARLREGLQHFRATSERETVGEGADSYVRERAVCSCGWKGPWLVPLMRVEPSIDVHRDEQARRLLEGSYG